MPCAVTLTANDIVASSADYRAELEAALQVEAMSGLRQSVQNMMGYIACHGLSERTLNRAVLAGAVISTRAIRLLPDEQSRLFLPLLALPRKLSDYESFMDLRRFFERVWSDTEKYELGTD